MYQEHNPYEYRGFTVTSTSLRMGRKNFYPLSSKVIRVSVVQRLLISIQIEHGSFRFYAIFNSEEYFVSVRLCTLFTISLMAKKSSPCVPPCIYTPVKQEVLNRLDLSQIFRVRLS